MKKAISLVLCLVMLAALVIPASAAESCKFTVTPSAAKVAAGETVEIAVAVAEGAACTEFAVLIEFDKDLFELTAYETVGAGFPIAIDGAAAGAKEEGFASMGGWSASVTEMTAPVAMVPQGEVGTIVLTAKADAEVAVTATAKACSSGTDVPAAAEVVPFEEEPPVTEPSEPDILWGDSTRDGRVNAMDATRILRYVVRAITEDKIDLVAADVTGDGRVNAMDATRILRYVVGSITEFPVESK